ncbi:unnamed protein product [Kuraishia capsulata CBS 1993]|uniref:Dynactin subunit 5 n=1 Tax=Kuraishia capsulata CBS 1993 TaxID=1382522 RepID=W6MLW2_9ASCO|nr:uncharacterized protein KUCA_T00001848001 [Kuraishia capsulata CBS 1993]CDK25877.1 unnamed protein product [Kuraishia capsulata CBS 1993]
MDYITTQSNNRIHRGSRIKGSSNIQIQGNTLVEECVIDAHEAIPDGSPTIVIGKYCILGRGVELKPPVSTSGVHPSAVGSYVLIGENCKIASAAIGSRVIVGEGCVLGNGSIIHDCCILDPGLVVPGKYVVPPFSHVLKWGDAFKVRHLNESHKLRIELLARRRVIA